jgi:hypothetical protein
MIGYPSQAAVTEDVVSLWEAGGVWRADSPVAWHRLVVLTCPYWDCEGVEHGDGTLVVLDRLAEGVKAIFSELHARRFPIAKMHPMERYGGDDGASMADNNTSAFVVRPVTMGTRWSLHSYGAAIDLNPVMNPYVSPSMQSPIIMPAEGSYWINRAHVRPGMVEPIVPIFERYGWEWGGRWNDPVDWMHFQFPRDQIESMV